MTESLNDKTISTLISMRDTTNKMEGINDYSDDTGFCQEYDQIVKDFSSHLGSIRIRFSQLERRISKYKKAIKS